MSLPTCQTWVSEHPTDFQVATRDADAARLKPSLGTADVLKLPQPFETI